MSSLHGCLLVRRSGGLALREDPVMIVGRGQVEAEFHANPRQDALHRRDARLSPATFDPGNLGLRHAGPLGQFTL